MTFKEQIDKEVEEGRVRSQVHPSLPLTIYKYTPETVYKRLWNEANLKCRGLVLDAEGNIVVNSMPKMFNHSEPDGEEVVKKNAGKKYTITDKADGSLIQAALYKGELVVTSSGSFTSTQAEKAREMLLYKYQDFSLEEDVTYIFEIIYPENRIVLDYGNQESLTFI